MATDKESGLANFSYEEMAFCAEDEKIDIIPNFALSTLRIFEGKYGPFRPQMKTEVPLWVAMMLKRRRRCRIITPDWMQLSRLDEVLNQEREQYTVFQTLPFHYIEIAEMIIKEAKDDVPDLHMVREKVGAIRSVRANKIQSGLKGIADSSPIQLNNLAAVEVSMIRSFFVGTLNRFYKQSTAEKAATEAAAEASRRQALEMARRAAGGGAGGPGSAPPESAPLPQARVLRR